MADVKRQLAAVMFTDIAGYTALVQADEDAAREVRERHRVTIEEEVSSAGGKLLQHFGDGTLSVFSSAVEAVGAGVEIQKRLRSYPTVPVRIGIHLGDIAYDEQGAYGDAVNVASRLEALAEPGSVLVSGKVFDEVRNKFRFPTVPLGEVRLKNVEGPVSLHAVAAEGLEIPNPADFTARVAERGAVIGSSWWNRYPLLRRLKARRVQIAVIGGLSTAAIGSVALVNWDVEGEPAVGVAGSAPATATIFRGDRPGIAILPFDNITTDPADSYFADGFHDELVTTLSYIGSIAVTSRESTLQYRGRSQTVPEVAQALGVDWILEGSVRKDGLNIRITAQLIEGETDDHMWSEQYDVALVEGEIFSIQSRIAEAVAREIGLEITDAEMDRITRASTDSPEAYELYLRALQNLGAGDPRALEASSQLLSRAISLDPDFAMAYAQLAALSIYVANNLGTPGLADSAAVLAGRAIELDSTLSYGHAVLGSVHTSAGRLSLAATSLERSLTLRPSDAVGYHQLALVEVLRGNLVDALRYFRQTLRLSPYAFQAQTYTAMVYFALGDPEEAMRWLERSEAIFPAYELSGVYRALWALREGRAGDVAAGADGVLRPRPIDNNNRLVASVALIQAGDLEAARVLLEPMAPALRDPTGVSVRSRYASVLTELEGQEAAEPLLDELLQQATALRDAGNELPGVALEIAGIHAMRGETELAYEWLERAFDGGWRLTWVMPSMLPFFTGMEGDQRYAAWLDRIDVDLERMREIAASDDLLPGSR